MLCAKQDSQIRYFLDRLCHFYNNELQTIQIDEHWQLSQTPSMGTQAVNRGVLHKEHTVYAIL